MRIWASISRVGSSERERFEVILESIETKIGVIADGHLALNEKLDRLEKKLDQLSSEVTFLRVDLGTVKHRVGNIEHQVQNIEHRVGTIEHHLGLSGVSKTGEKKPTTGTSVRRKREQGS